MIKKIVLAIIVAIIVIICGVYIYSNRTSSADESFKSFISDCNKFQLDSAKEYVNPNGDLSKGISQIQNYNSMKQAAMKNWLKAIKVNILSTKKENGEAVLVAEIYSPNGKEIYNEFQQSMDSLNIDSQTIQDNNLNGDFLGAQYNNAFTNAIDDNINNVVQTKVEIKMKRNLGDWKITNDDQVITALLGGLTSNAVIS